MERAVNNQNLEDAVNQETGRKIEEAYYLGFERGRQSGRVEGAKLTAITVSHEVNNALSIVQGYKDLLEESIPQDLDNKDITLALSKIQEGVERIRTTTLKLAAVDKVIETERDGTRRLDLDKSTKA